MKQIKARLCCHPVGNKYALFDGDCDVYDTPVAVLYTNKESIEAMVEQIARVLSRCGVIERHPECWWKNWKEACPSKWRTSQEDARTILQSLGIKQPRSIKFKKLVSP